MKLQGVPEPKNPMLNHVVLERVFELAEFNFESFANYRLVCKQWYETSLPTWRKKTWLSVTARSYDDGIPVADYLQHLKSQDHRLVNVPFRKYIICMWHNAFHDFEGKLEPEKLEFWKTVGQHITHLCIDFCSFHTTTNLRKILFEFTPNLQSLILSKNSYLDYGYNGQLQNLEEEQEEVSLNVNSHLTELKILETYGDFPISWTDIIRSFPSIKSLQVIELDPTKGTRSLITLLKTVELLRIDNPHCLANLVELRLLELEGNRRNTFTLELATLLKRLQFPLKVLTLDVGAENDIFNVRQALQLVLEGYAETLEELTFAKKVRSFQSHDFPYGINFPKLIKFSSTGGFVQNLKFLKHMPNLELLHLEQNAGQIYLRHFGDYWSSLVLLNNLKEFKITAASCTEKQIIFLGKMMPNLTNITIGLRNKFSFKTLCRIWKDVKYLNIYTLNESEDAYWNSEKAYIQSNMKNLKNLKSLKIGESIIYGEGILS
ncbi:unnamed protein product [Orchesella dallaii]|uniref:F-box domain-containing protein n=1 Tax=Orchesella dallaii TaxID=48710 RepID=A0ABP1PM80_9HEXA